MALRQGNGRKEGKKKRERNCFKCIYIYYIFLLLGAIKVREYIRTYIYIFRFCQTFNLVFKVFFSQAANTIYIYIHVVYIFILFYIFIKM